MRTRSKNVPRHIFFLVTVDGITKGGPAGVLLPAGMKKKYFRKSFSLSMLLSYKSDVTGVCPKDENFVNGLCTEK